MADATGIVPMRLRDVDERLNAITGDVVDSAIRVQRVLGSGLLERPYEIALAHELRRRGRSVRTQVPLDVRYEDLVLPKAYVLDLLVDESVVVELKTVNALERQHFAQMATYLRFSGLRLGLLINFHASPLKTGIQRVVRPQP